MGVYDTLVIPGTPADGEQVKCWNNRMHSVRVGNAVPPIITVDVQGSFPDEEHKETYHRDYVIVMRCGGCLVVRDCKLQGYYLEAKIIPGEPLVGTLPMFDKWGEWWNNSRINCGLMGEPYFYAEGKIARSIEALARARPTPVKDQDTL